LNPPKRKELSQKHHERSIDYQLPIHPTHPIHIPTPQPFPPNRARQAHFSRLCDPYKTETENNQMVWGHEHGAQWHERQEPSTRSFSLQIELDKPIGNNYTIPL